jgi:hypothetical protein
MATPFAGGEPRAGEAIALFMYQGGGGCQVTSLRMSRS